MSLIVDGVESCGDEGCSPRFGSERREGKVGPTLASVATPGWVVTKEEGTGLLQEAVSHPRDLEESQGPQWALLAGPGLI